MRKIFRYWWIGLFSLLLGVGAVSFFAWTKYVGFSEVYRVSNSNFEIRVIEKATIIFNYTYLFQSSSTNSKNWSDIFEYTSDPDSTKEMIQIVDDSTGYIRSSRVYAVTRDAGKSWTFSELDNIFQMTEETASCTWIKVVKIEADGSGIMSLRGCSTAKPLITEDYGLTWR